MRQISKFKINFRILIDKNLINKNNNGLNYASENGEPAIMPRKCKEEKNLEVFNE